MLAAVVGKLTARRSACAPLAGKSTLNRLELGRATLTRYHKITHDGAAIERLFVELFLDASAAAPAEIVLDLDATDDPLHGHQEGRFFRGYDDSYCDLPLSIFCGDPSALRQAAARQHRCQRRGGRRGGAPRRPDPRPLAAGAPIVLRADSGFARVFFL